MSSHTVEINRAPVLTMWAYVVAERLGFEQDEALTLGKALAGLNAQSKGRSLGIFEPTEESTDKARQRKHDETFLVNLLGRDIPSINTDDGIRALNKDNPIDPDSVRRYLHGKFGDDYPRVHKAMTALAEAFDKEDLADQGYDLYEQFRPEIPKGKRGWGAKGPLNLNKIRGLTNRA